MHKLVVLLLITTTSDNIVVRNLYTTKITPKLPPIFCIIDTVNGLTDTNSMIITMMDNIYQAIYIYTRLVKEISSRMSKNPKSIRSRYIYIYIRTIFIAGKLKYLFGHFETQKHQNILSPPILLKG